MRIAVNTFEAIFHASSPLFKHDITFSGLRHGRKKHRHREFNMHQYESGETMSNIPSAAPYGTWKSPLIASMLAQKTVSFNDLQIEGDEVFWIESRPEDEGRSVIVRQAANGSPNDINASPFNARTRVHEYGGGAFTVHAGTIFFSHYHDHRLYQQSLGGGEVYPITAPSSSRYADLHVDASHHRIIAVREDHRNPHAIENTLVSIPLESSDGIGEVLVEGHDFYMFPRISPNGQQLAWISWDYPNMPWDNTQLWIADIKANGTITHPRKIAGDMEESIFQPEWSPDGILYFISDRSGWWNIYRWIDAEVHPITALRAEFGAPAWIFGLSAYGFISDKEILATYSQNGYARLVQIDIASREITHLPCPYTALSHVRVSADHIAMIAASDREPSAIVTFDLTTKRYRTLKKSSSELLDGEYLSTPEAIEYPTEGGLSAHAFYYAPKNRDYFAPEGESPPLVVYAHGGPTGHSGPLFRLGVQYWTTRGFAVVDVNYGGSTGYGRAYRNRLRGQWGIVDIQDVVNAALFLTRHGKADRKRLLIRGGSAGGYTTLAALTFQKVFRAGASYFGVSDLAALARETHKFESHYLDLLVGRIPEDEDIYEARSPIFHTDELTAPVIFFQGLDDHVVLPNQAEKMVESLKDHHIAVAYITFPGEGHGFVQAHNIIRAQEAELYFYAKVLGIRLAERIDPVFINNFDRHSEDG